MVFAILAAAAGFAAPAWYGPATADLSDRIIGNPFLPAQNDVRAVFTQGGRRFDRIAYWDAGKWHATLSADRGGTYDVQFIWNGKTIGAKSKVTLNRAKGAEFVKLDGTRFKLASGKPYIPFGHNLGWQGSPADTYEKQLADMAKAGLNWTRIWSDAWDTKNPFVPPNREIKLETGWFYTPATDRWDMVIRKTFTLAWRSLRKPGMTQATFGIARM